MLAYFFSSCESKDKPWRTAPLRVETETLVTSLDFHHCTYVGVIEEGSSVSMSFTGSGTISAIGVGEGQYVKKGQLIAELDKTQAQNMLTAAQAQMRQAEDAYQRLKQLHEAQSLPEMEWVEVQSKVEQAQAQLDLARNTLADCSIYAPINGVIGKGIMQRGETVLPSMRVASILDITRVKVRASIPEKEIASIQSSSPTLIQIDALPGETFQGGRIDKLSEGNVITHTYEIMINIENHEKTLLPGMVAKVTVEHPSEKLMLTVPITSVRKNAYGESYVWKVIEGKAFRTMIEKGEARGNRIQILSGLKEGDIIVTEGYQKLSEGMEVV